MCEYKAEMKCTWTAESNRMKGSVQLGLLCLSLLISSLHGQEETDRSMEIPINFEEPDLLQPEMYRVRRQTEKDDTAKTEVVVPPSENGKIKRGKRPHQGAFSVLNGSKDSEVHRTKRQSKSNNKQKKRPGRYSLLGMGAPQIPQTGRAKRDENAGGKRTWPGS